MDTPPFVPDKNPKKKAVAGKKGYGSSVASHLAQMAMKKIKEKKLKEGVEHLEELTTRIHMPVYDKYITDVRRKKGGGSITYGEVAAHHGTEALPDIIKHLTKERDDLMTKHRTVKVGMLHDNAIKGFKSVLKHSNMNEEKTMLTLRDILEGRGRPRKNPDDPKWHAKPAVKKSEDDDEEEDHGPARPESPHLHTEPDKHISVQLKVAHDMKDEKGGADVKFANGKTHFVKHDVAHKVLSALDKLKPADRAKVHDHIAQSHENLMAVHKVL